MYRLLEARIIGYHTLGANFETDVSHRTGKVQTPIDASVYLERPRRYIYLSEAKHFVVLYVRLPRWVWSSFVQLGKKKAVLVAGVWEPSRMERGIEETTTTAVRRRTAFSFKSEWSMYDTAVSEGQTDANYKCVRVTYWVLL